MLLWTATDGSGESWTPYSLSAAHNAGMTDPSLKYDANVNSTDADMIEMLKTGGDCSRCKAGSTCPHIGTTVDDLPVKHGYCNMSRVSNVGPIRYRAR